MVSCDDVRFGSQAAPHCNNSPTAAIEGKAAPQALFPVGRKNSIGDIKLPIGTHDVGRQGPGLI